MGLYQDAIADQLFDRGQTNLLAFSAGRIDQGQIADLVDDAGHATDLLRNGNPDG